MTTEEFEVLMSSEISKVNQTEMLELIKSIKGQVRSETRIWNYGIENQEFTCWVAFEHLATKTSIVYCNKGFGPNYPWGLLSTNTPNNDMGIDSQWYISLEDAIRNSDFWHGTNPKDYEVN